MRSKEGKELERTFNRIENWEGFLKKWEEIDTEQEAIGLLYAGANIPSDNVFKLKEEGEELERRVKFCLQEADYKNSKIVATTAEQVIVKQWLKQLTPFQLCGYYQGYLNANVMVLRFLQNPRESLTSEPYPRFVSKYLLPLYEIWHHGSAPDYQKGKDFQVFQNYTELIVRVFCAWGLAYVLAQDGLRPEIIPMIKKFLDEKHYDVHDVFMGLSGYGDPPNNLDRKDILHRAACAYLKLMYWVGDGVVAKFDRLKCIQRLKSLEHTL